MLKVSDFDHIPVLLYQTVDALNVRPGGIYVDCTAGGGSHSAEIARRMKGQGILVSIDKDGAALAACMERKAAFAGLNWMPVKSDYKDIDDIIRSLKIGKVDGIMADSRILILCRYRCPFGMVLLSEALPEGEDLIPLVPGLVTAVRV